MDQYPARHSTTPEDAERHVEALPPARWRNAPTHSAKPRTFAQCLGSCHQGRRPCVHPEYCQAAPAPAEASTEIGAEAGANPPTAQRMGEAAGNFIGFGAVALLAFMGAASYAGAPVVQWLASLLKALVH